MPYPPTTLGGAFSTALLFAVLGILLALLGYKAFDLLTPKLDLEKELMGGNIAVAIVIAAVIIGVSWIVVAAMS